MLIVGVIIKRQNMIDLVVKYITEPSGTKRLVVAEFNGGYSHIGCDDHCWIILNGGKPSRWIFSEAVKALKMLPDSPDQHKLLQKAFRELHEDLEDLKNNPHKANIYLATSDFFNIIELAKSIIKGERT